MGAGEPPQTPEAPHPPEPPRTPEPPQTPGASEARRARKNRRAPKGRKAPTARAAQQQHRAPPPRRGGLQPRGHAQQQHKNDQRRQPRRKRDGEEQHQARRQRTPGVERGRRRAAVEPERAPPGPLTQLPADFFADGPCDRLRQVPGRGQARLRVGRFITHVPPGTRASPALTRTRHGYARAHPQGTASDGALISHVRRRSSLPTGRSAGRRVPIPRDPQTSTPNRAPNVLDDVVPTTSCRCRRDGYVWGTRNRDATPGGSTCEARR